MSIATDLVKLRKRVSDAVRAGVVEEADHGIYEATLIQILNESERQRVRCSNLVDEFKRKAAQAEAQASAYSQVSSIIYNVINGYVLLAEKSQREEEDRAQERKETVGPTDENVRFLSGDVTDVEPEPAESEPAPEEPEPEGEEEPEKTVVAVSKPAKKASRRKRR
jgi:hypothetical protein